MKIQVIVITYFRVRKAVEVFVALRTQTLLSQVWYMQWPPINVSSLFSTYPFIR